MVDWDDTYDASEASRLVDQLVAERLDMVNVARTFLTANQGEKGLGNVPNSDPPTPSRRMSTAIWKRPSQCCALCWMLMIAARTGSI